MKVIFFFVLGEIRKVGPEICFADEYILSLISSGNYMIKGARVMDTRFAGHRDLLQQRGFFSITYYDCLTPYYMLLLGLGLIGLAGFRKKLEKS